MILIRHTSALARKFILTFVIAALTLYFIDLNPLGWVVWAAFVTTVVNYLVGDLLILPGYGRSTASVADGVMAGIVAYMFALIIPVFRLSLLSLIMYGALIGVAEYYFHAYLRRAGTVET